MTDKNDKANTCDTPDSDPRDDRDTGMDTVRRGCGLDLSNSVTSSGHTDTVTYKTAIEDHRDVNKVTHNIRAILFDLYNSETIPVVEITLTMMHEHER